MNNDDFYAMHLGLNGTETQNQLGLNQLPRAESKPYKPIHTDYPTCGGENVAYNQIESSGADAQTTATVSSLHELQRLPHTDKTPSASFGKRLFVAGVLFIGFACFVAAFDPKQESSEWSHNDTEPPRDATQVLAQPPSAAPVSKSLDVEQQGAPATDQPALSIESYGGLFKYHHIARYQGRHHIYSYSRTPPGDEVESIDVAFTLQRRGAFSRLSLVSEGGRLPRREVAPGAASFGDYLRINGQDVFAAVVMYRPPSTASRHECDNYAKLLMESL